MFGKKSIDDLDSIITCIIDFFLDPFKPHFYYISTGLRGSDLHGDFFGIRKYRDCAIYVAKFEALICNCAADLRLCFCIYAKSRVFS